MNKGMLFITIAVVIVAALFGVMSFINFEPTTPYVSDSETSSQTESNSQSAEEIPLPEQDEMDSSGITLSVLAQHSSEEDCWVGYKGKVYDLTSFLPKHPGSAGAIAPHCGTSGQFEQAFQNKHGDSKASMFMKVAIYKGDLT